MLSAITALVGFCVFIVWEWVENPYPIVDLRLFKRRNFWTGTLALALGYGVFFGNVVLLPLWLQEYMGYTATEAGMLTAPVGILALSWCRRSSGARSARLIHAGWRPQHS